jgi:phosphatidylethanolamine/phosphatidyl-N-methylethanolamine N-methyltransferase
LFWAAAREKYRGVTADDEDVRKFLELSNSFQTDIYEGLSGTIQDLGHKWVAARTPAAGRVLEIGFGAGRHSLFFSGRRDRYFASEFSPAHLGSPLWASFGGPILRCDARRLPFPAATFDAVISIYNLEHITDLQGVFREVHRVLAPKGTLLIGLPCEGGFLWNIGRELTSRRMFMKKYGINYDKVIAYEHVWDFKGVERSLRDSALFTIEARRFYPFFLPAANLNLIACLRCTKAATGRGSVN